MMTLVSESMGTHRFVYSTYHEASPPTASRAAWAAVKRLNFKRFGVTISEETRVCFAWMLNFRSICVRIPDKRLRLPSRQHVRPCAQPASLDRVSFREIQAHCRFAQENRCQKKKPLKVARRNL